MLDRISVPVPLVCGDETHASRLKVSGFLLLLQIGAAVGLPFPQWYDAGKTADLGNWSFGE